MGQLGASPPRRITRSALARFAYTGAADGEGMEKSRKRSPEARDIEDVIPDTAASTLQKRKRTTTVSVSRTTPSSPPPRRKSRKGGAADVKLDNDAGVKIEQEIEDIAATTSSIPPRPTARKQRKPARRTTDPSTGETIVTPPTGWEEIYDVVRAMRAPGGAAASAPVDTMGCERLALPTASPRDRRLQTLVALMLSSQTRDTVNAAAMRRLQTELPPPGLNLANLLAVPAETLNELIRAVGFHNNKTKYLKRAAEICRDEHGGDIPDTLEGLVALPGVGPKMAHLCLQAAWGRTEGVGVDVHVHRITNLWGWHGAGGGKGKAGGGGGGGGGGSRDPEDTRRRLEAWLPRDRWREINALLVGLGQTVCLPVGRRCGDCELGLRGLCPAADRKKVAEGRRVRERERESLVAQDVKGEEDEEEEEATVKVEGERIDEVEKGVVVNETV
ncbi:DNA glycosylase [Xylaria palmicola]|nr:DNA glycosylase [Xylaria palmicola]